MPKRLHPETNKGYRFKDRTGQRTGRLTFVRQVGLDKHSHHMWEAICDCGATCITSSPHKTKSCGCLQRERAAEVQRLKALPPDVKRANEKANRVRQRARRRSDPLTAMQSRLSRLHRHALRQVGAIKSSPTFERLGYTVSEFVSHMERQFLPGMSWANLKDWQIDHIVPISEARSEEDVVSLNQLANLRPMWAKENNRKKAKRVSLL